MLVYVYAIVVHSCATVASVPNHLYIQCLEKYFADRHFSENFRQHSRLLSFHIGLRIELTSKYNFRNPLLGFACEFSVSNKQFLCKY